MPATLTHTYFVIDGINSLDKKTQKLLKDSMEILKITAQSTDPFMFYSFLKPWNKNKNLVTKFARIFHTTKTGEFLITFTEYIKKNNYINNPDIIAMLYGFISHYVLDSSAHPYVYYKTGKFKGTKKNTYKYNSKHHLMESYIDSYMVEKKENIKSNKYKCYSIFENIHKFNNETNTVLDHIFKEVYNYDDFSKDYITALKDMRFLFKHIRYDTHGYSDKLLYIRDLLTPNSKLKYRFLSYHHMQKNGEQYLNIEKKNWHYAADNTIMKKLSFEELYNEALKKYINIIKEINKYLYTDTKIDLHKVYGNLSYETGLDWTLEKVSKYFEF